MCGSFVALRLHIAVSLLFSERGTIHHISDLFLTEGKISEKYAKKFLAPPSLPLSQNAQKEDKAFVER